MITIEYLDHSIPVYDITVEDNENFYANDILVHNCLEITLPTKPLQFSDDPTAEVALCTLAAINFGKMKEPTDFERPAELLVRALNELLDYQEYPVQAAYNATMGRRPLGVGISNLAYWIAKNGYKYSDDTSLVHFGEMMEGFQYYLMKASVEVAKETGPCPMFNETKYSKGIMPVDAYKHALDEILPHKEVVDWNWLRAQVLEHGMANSTLSALMPVETSSQIINATNGIEPPRSLVSVKGSADGRLKQVVPGISRLKNKYELAWDMPNTRGYLKVAAVAQKYVDQAISTSTWYNPENYENNEIPMLELIQDDLLAFKYGLKTLYYCNTNDGASDDFSEDDDCAGGGCKL